MRPRHVVAVVCAAVGVLHAGSDKSSDLAPAMESYAPKSCKFNLLPSTLSTRAYTAYTGEVRIHDVFGIPSTIKRHIVKLEVSTPALITLQAEVHRDTPTTLSVDAYRAGEVGLTSGRVLSGKNLNGAGGEDTKAFLHGQVGDKEKAIDLLFELISVDVAASQVDSRIAETKCWPVRLDLTVIPLQRAPLYWPLSCPERSQLPPPLQPDASSQVVVLGDTPLQLKPEDGKHFSFRFGDERPWNDFERSLWTATVEVPPRLHRFVRLFLRTTFHFAGGPLQLMIELFDLKDTPDGSDLYPKCTMGCLGGVPVFNGQIIDHAMPTGFRYRLWLLAASLSEWTVAIPDRGRHCTEFDLDYSIGFENRITPFEVGPAAWLCEYSRLPGKIVQSAGPVATDKLAGTSEVISGRSIWVRDRFGFPPDEVENMEHEITIEVSEPCVFRATTHHSDGVDIFVALKKAGDTTASRVCQSYKHKGPVPRQSIFCLLQPGTYTLIFFADYPLGGLHPCSDFFAQLALRPTALADEDNNKQCVRSASDLSSLSVERSLAATTTPRWKAIRIPISFEQTATSVSIWSQSVTITEQEVAERLYLRLVLHSDYVSSDLRFQVKYEGRYVADTQVTSHGYADMIGPLDAGTYTVEMYYVAGTNGPKDLKLCSVSTADLRVVSRSAYANRTSQWLCTSTRVPPPEMLQPQPDEQVLLDSEYLIPDSGVHNIKLQLSEPRLIRIMAKSSDADFRLELAQASSNPTSTVTGTKLATGDNNLEALVGKGTYTLKLISSARGSGGGTQCSVFLLNLLLTQKELLPLCPWAASSTDRSATADAQRQASDHIGSLLLDLVPKHLTKEVEVKPPVTLWMNQGMEKTFELELDDTSALRLDVSMQPPFLPLEVVVRRKRASGKLEAPIATAEWTESRLLLMAGDLPRGTYSVEFRQPRKYQVLQGSESDLQDLCSHVTVSAEVGVSSKEAVNSMRSELLDLPDLLAVQPLPPSLNSVGWFSSSMVPVVGTQVYKLGDESRATLKVEDRSALRLVCEPADLSNAEIEGQVLQNGATIATSDNLGQLVTEVQPGTYEIRLKPKAPAPFLVTIGLATEPRLKEDFALTSSGRCLDAVPDLVGTMSFPKSGWSIGPTVVRLKNNFLRREGLLAKMPIQLTSPSILYIEAGSALPLDLVRIALEVPEGLWIGEQRGVRNSLEIELPVGKYTVQVSQPRTLGSMDSINRCLDFSVYVTARPLNPGAAADSAEAAAASLAGSTAASQTNSDAVQKQELAPREEAVVEAAPCFAMGTNPLPLDLSDPAGGSQMLGGPLSKDGRLLIRTRAMLTDMHNGRKKVYLSTRGKKLQLKVAVMLGGYTKLSLASQLSFTVQKVGGPSVSPLESWTQQEGWERVYVLDGDGFWIQLHHGLRERSESACLHFGLQMEVHPVDDIKGMIQCGDSVGSPQEMFPTDLNIPSGSKDIFRYVKQMTFLRQEQMGFLNKIRFTLDRETYVSAEVGYNFFISHAEMDIVPASKQDTMFPLATAEIDWIHSPNSQITTQAALHKTLPPGDYVLRVADDHYKDQLSGVYQACFPFSFEFRAVPSGAAPTVVSVQPHPSVPVVRGTDLVLTIRFSEPPKGDLSQVVSGMYLGGVQADTGGSMNAMEANWASSKRTTVQASTSEGHKVWVVAWSADVLSGMNTAKLRLGGIVSNVTGMPFKFNSPTFSIVDAPKGEPWSGGAVKDDGASKASSATASASSEVAAEDGRRRRGSVGTPVAEGGGSSLPQTGSSVGAPVAEGQAASTGGQRISDADAGAVRAETPRAPARLPEPSRPARPAEGRVIEDDDDDDDIDSGDHSPNVVEWNPMDDDGGQTHRRRRSKSDESPTVEPEASVDGQAPTGSRTVYVLTAIAVGVFAVMYYNPQLRGVVDKKLPSGRFRDIGQRTSEEELSLVQSANRAYDDDDDML